VWVGIVVGVVGAAVRVVVGCEPVALRAEGRLAGFEWSFGRGGVGCSVLRIGKGRRRWVGGSRRG